MRIVIAPDSFKESLTATEAASAMADGVRQALPDADCVLVPMSDGGEGFTDAVASAWDARWVEVDTVDALGRPVRARYAMVGQRAVLDLASSCGLELIAPMDRDVEAATTFGFGLVLRDAVGRGARELLVGIGGSATNDGGAGMLVALGARLLDGDGRELGGAPSELGRVASVDAAAVAELFADVEVRVACDVTNPLTGPSGATAVFGPQKGVAPGRVAALDAVLERFADVAGFGHLAGDAGAGAAGGVGFALQAFLGAELAPGVGLVADAVGLADVVAGADLVLTGEGAVDAQTLAGKTPAGVAEVAAAAGVECVVLAGVVRAGAEALLDHGVAELVQITPGASSGELAGEQARSATGQPSRALADALANARQNLTRATAALLADRACGVTTAGT